MHLKAIQQMGKFPRSIGAADSGIEEDPETSMAVQPSVNALAPVEDAGRIDPLAGMGLTQQQYQLILHGLVNGDSSLSSAVNGTAGAGVSMGGEKRSLADAEDERDGKRGRFEVLE